VFVPAETVMRPPARPDIVVVAMMMMIVLFVPFVMYMCVFSLLSGENWKKFKREPPEKKANKKTLSSSY